MEMSGNTQTARLKLNATKYNSLRERSLISKWVDLRKEYLGYREKARFSI